MEKELNLTDDMRPSFWFMRDDHTFIKPSGKNVEEIRQSLINIAKENPYGMVCSVIIVKGNKEIRRVGPTVHVDGNGNVDLTNWCGEIMNDDVVRIFEGKQKHSNTSLEEKTRLSEICDKLLSKVDTNNDNPELFCDSFDWNLWLKTKEEYLKKLGYKKYYQNLKREDFAYWKIFNIDNNEAYQIGLLFYDYRKYNESNSNINANRISIQYECMLINCDSRVDLSITKDNITLVEFEKIALDFYNAMLLHFKFLK